ncbi:MAG: TRAP transporter large permease subunit [Limnochordales bacterium]|nr:C4-dicarboxylate ABC transporter permease [Bacillota bacterium]
MLSEAVLFLIMVAAFIALAAVRMPVSLSLLGAAALGALLGGQGLALRHLVEGGFMYLDAILIIVTAMAFMGAMRASGALSDIARQLLNAFGNKPVVLLPALMVLTMLPGMLSGSSSAAVLTAGALVGPVLMALGLDKLRAGAFIAMGGIYGLVAPPVNVPVMIIGSGVDIPYIGFEGPLVIASVPLAIVTAYVTGWPLLKRGRADVQGALRAMEEAERQVRAGGGEVLAAASPSPRSLKGFWAWLPLLWVVLSMTLSRVAVGWWPDLGLALTFAIGTGLILLISQVPNWLGVLRAALRQALPVLGILVGVGAFIQVMTLVGGRGWMVVSLLSLPAGWLYLAAALGIPLFGAVSAYGATSVLGVPLVLAFLQSGSEIVITAAISLLAGLGDLMPPTALAGIFAGQVVGEKNYGRILLTCLPFAILSIVYAIGMILLA